MRDKVNRGESLMEFHKGMGFSTYDNDNGGSDSENCAEKVHGGWWYGSCYESNLNGRYYNYELDTADCVPTCAALGCHTHQTVRAEQPLKPRNTFCSPAPSSKKQGHNTEEQGTQKKKKVNHSN
nr:hypothetical protein BaRGS_017383 [Batillaria attramentaria]